MAIKYTIQGLLIYLAMAGYLLAFFLRLAGRAKFAWLFYGCGFALALAALVYRWVHVAHVPMQNLFEVFLLMSVLLFPLSFFCRHFLRVGGEGADMFIGIVILIPSGFFFSAQPQLLPPALQCWLFAPHVAVYMISYVLMAKAAVQAFARLSSIAPADTQLCDYETGAYRMVCLGFPLMSLGLLLGSWWGHLAWGDYWGWDPKELWSLAAWLIFLGYLHFRYLCGRKYPRLNSFWVILGLTAIIVTLLWVNLSNLFTGLHSYAT